MALSPGCDLASHTEPTESLYRMSWRGRLASVCGQPISNDEKSRIMRRAEEAISKRGLSGPDEILTSIQRLSAVAAIIGSIAPAPPPDHLVIAFEHLRTGSEYSSEPGAQPDLPSTFQAVQALTAVNASVPPSTRDFLARKLREVDESDSFDEIDDRGIPALASVALTAPSRAKRYVAAHSRLLSRWMQTILEQEPDGVGLALAYWVALVSMTTGVKNLRSAYEHFATLRIAGSGFRPADGLPADPQASFYAFNLARFEDSVNRGS